MCLIAIFVLNHLGVLFFFFYKKEILTDTNVDTKFIIKMTIFQVQGTLDQETYSPKLTFLIFKKV